MRLHRFYIPELVGNRAELTVRSVELINQLRRVFRLKIGEEIAVFDGSGSDYTAAIARYDGADRVVLDVRGSARSRFMPGQVPGQSSGHSRKISLCAALVKKDNFELITEKATELGVTDIIPVLAERSEKKAVNEARLKKIVIEASEQSGRGDVPRVHAILDLKEALALCRSGQINAIAFHTEGEPFTHDDIKDIEDGVSLALFIGPEGGWSPAELDMFHTNDVAVRCLGPQVLRAETAVVAALSVVVFAH